MVAMNGGEAGRISLSWRTRTKMEFHIYLLSASAKAGSHQAMYLPQYFCMEEAALQGNPFRLKDPKSISYPVRD